MSRAQKKIRQTIAVARAKSGQRDHFRTLQREQRRVIFRCSVHRAVLAASSKSTSMVVVAAVELLLQIVCSLFLCYNCPVRQQPTHSTQTANREKKTPFHRIPLTFRPFNWPLFRCGYASCMNILRVIEQRSRLCTFGASEKRLDKHGKRGARVMARTHCITFTFSNRCYTAAAIRKDTNQVGK